MIGGDSLGIPFWSPEEVASAIRRAREQMESRRVLAYPTETVYGLGGEILDPKNGRVYSAKITPSKDGKSLDVRGFIGVSLIGRTQTWLKE